MQRLTYKNPLGKELTFKLEDPYVIWKVDGLGITDMEPISTQSVGQDGYTLHDLLSEPRTIKVTGHVIDSKGSVRQMYAERRRMNSILSPALGMGLITYTNDALTVMIKGYVKSIDYGDKDHFVHTITINFECPYPYFEDTQKYTHSLAYVEGGLQFPLITPNKFGILDYRVVIENTGDISAPIQMTVHGGSTTATNPKITNVTTGEFILINKVFASNETIYIDTDPEKSIVEITRDDGDSKTTENAYGYLSTNSSLFSLVPGENEILFESEDENKNVRITIIQTNYRVGV